MERLKKTFTCLFIFSALLGIATIMGSCQQAANKQKQADGTAQTNASDANQAVRNGTNAPAGGNQVQQPSGPGSVNPAAQGNATGHNSKNASSSKEAKMLNDFANNPAGNPAQLPKINVTPEQQKARQLYFSGSKKSSEDDQRGAIEDFTESLNLNKVPIVYMKRGFAELISEDFNAALNDMNEALKLDPKLARAYFGRGVCRFEMKDFKTAEEDMNLFIDKDKTSAIAYNYIAGCRFMEQDFKGALENYEMVAKLDPNYPDVYTNRGMMKHYLNDLKGAVEDYNKALALDPNNATAYNNRGGAKLNQQNYKDALEDFNKAISLKKDYADAYDNRGKAKIMLGDNTGACEDWQRSYSLGIESSRDLILKYCGKGKK